MDKKLLGDIKQFLEEEADHFDFKNGNTDPTGTIDEGDVLGWKYYNGLLERISEEIRTESAVRKASYEDMMMMRRRLTDVYLPSGLVIGLTTLMQVQEVVSSPVDGCIPPAGEKPTKDALRTYVLAMTVELMEFIQCLNWKPWKNKPVLDLENIASEFADILAFQGIIIKYLDTMGIGPVQLAEAYANKSIINIDRFLGLHGIEYQQPSLLEKKEE